MDLWIIMDLLLLHMSFFLDIYLLHEPNLFVKE